MMDKEITFDIEKFLNEDCKEENEIGIKMTSSILSKAFNKGLQHSALYCYKKGMKDANTKFIAMLTELREKACYHHSKFDDDRDFEVDKAVEDIVNHIDARIDKLKGEDLE